MKKQLNKVLLIMLIPLLPLFLIMFFIIIFALSGGGAVAAVPIIPPATREKALEYGMVASEMGIPWDLVIISDALKAEEEGENEIEKVHPIHTCLDFLFFEEKTYRYTVVGYEESDEEDDEDDEEEPSEEESEETETEDDDEEEEDNRVPIYDWQYESSKFYFGEEEILKYAKLKEKDVETMSYGAILKAIQTAAEVITTNSGRDFDRLLDEWMNWTPESEESPGGLNPGDVVPGGGPQPGDVVDPGDPQPGDIVPEEPTAPGRGEPPTKKKVEVEKLELNEDFYSVLTEIIGIEEEYALKAIDIYESNYLSYLYFEDFADYADYELPEITVGDVSRLELAQIAASIMGHPYQWGGKSGSIGSPSGGLDCSGFIDWVYIQCFGRGVNGVSINDPNIVPNGTAIQFYSSSEISENDLQIGDLGFYKRPEDVTDYNHVGIYIGEIDGQPAFIHAGGSSFGTDALPDGRVGISINQPGSRNDYNPLTGETFDPPMKGTNFAYFRRPNFQFNDDLPEQPID